MKMRLKNLLGFFLIIASVLLLTASVSAAEYTIYRVEVNDIVPTNSDDTPASVTAGETAKIEVWFKTDIDFSEDYDRDVTVEAELDTGKEKVRTVSESMIIESGDSKKVTLTLQVPYELKDVCSELVDLTIEIDGEKYEVTEDYKLRVKRVQYNADVMSINTEQSVEAGDTFPVDIVLKNIGYNDLDDMYVTVGIPALELEKTVYVGDLIAVENESDDDDEDTLSMRLYLRIPYDAVSGIYALEVEATNDDLSIIAAKQIVIKNDFSSNVVTTDYRKTFSVGENGEYSLLIVNPTNKVKIYRVVPESTGSLSVRASESVVAVPAGSSKTVKIFARADAGGEYQFDVNVFSGEELVGTTRLSANVEGAAVQNAVVVLTIVLAIIFVVLLIVLIVLLRKKPEKAEEFGESYY